MPFEWVVTRFAVKSHCRRCVFCMIVPAMTQERTKLPDSPIQSPQLHGRDDFAVGKIAIGGIDTRGKRLCLEGSEERTQVVFDVL